MIRSALTTSALAMVLAFFAHLPEEEPKDAKGWFLRAHDAFALREQGAAPFHLHASFRAYPGMEVQAKEIVTGEGTYDEVWLAPHRWRREVSLASYHAVEVQSGSDRWMQASSDYEPSRVLMLMEALLDPVPRNLVDPELNEIPLGWKVEHRAAGDLAFVRIGRTWTTSLRPFVFAYLLLPNGMLVQSDQAGLVTGWQDEVNFHGRAVPQRITVGAGQRPLLTVDVAIADDGDVSESMFVLPGPVAEPGMTLRPVQRFETHGPELLEGEYSYVGGSAPPFVMRQIIDRHGTGRELEVIAAPEHADLSGLRVRARECRSLGFARDDEWRV